MPQEMTTQEQFDAFAHEVARKLGTHCRTAPNDEYARGLARLIIDDEGRALNLCQPDDRQPARLKVSAALPDDSEVQAPSIGVTASSAQHVAREITRRLYPLHTEISQMAAQLTARKETEARDRRGVAEALAEVLPGARVQEQHRRTDVYWQRASQPQGQPGPVQVDSVRAAIGASGESVSVEVSGRPQGIVAMLAAFAEQ
ncbi:hypothetical protein [Streptomyces mirabilis]|uniref:hypothetical protein n=1 Tax=Streptomyces mirabilis TaxID=68239 RepID=UPI00224EC0F1|nr:hypothetical protein [Streptomyces mirabilis]MCX4429506.1 hypothetical protein [Streptomyces mirabilis]